MLMFSKVHASLYEWNSGAFRPSAFSTDSYLDAYNEHVTLLTVIKENNVNGYHTMMHRIYRAAW